MYLAGGGKPKIDQQPGVTEMHAHTHLNTIIRMRLIAKASK